MRTAVTVPGPAIARGDRGGAVEVATRDHDVAPASRVGLGEPQADARRPADDDDAPVPTASTIEAAVQCESTNGQTARVDAV